jgi:hypothetical protein
MTLLEIVQTACNELGLVAPAAVATATDMQTIQLMALANRDCKNMVRDYDWTDLQQEHIINVEAATETTGVATNNSAIITGIPDTTGLDTTYAVSGTGQPQAQRIAEVLSSTSVRCEMLATADATYSLDPDDATGSLVFAKDTYALPDGFNRYISQTWWDRTNHWRLIGPDSPQAYQYIHSGIFATGPRIRWRQLGKAPNAWRIWPPPFSAGNTPDALVFEFITNNWVLNPDGTSQSSFTADDQEPLIDSDLIVMGVKWRMWQIKGFEYAAMQQEYIDAVNATFAKDGGIPDLYLNRRQGPFLLSSANVKDGDWPGPGNP